MAFGQNAGPPATHRQLEELLDLLVEAGFNSFKEARYPMDFTQSQAGGKFTRDDADTYISRLQETPAEADGPAPSPVTRMKASPAEQALQKYPSDVLAAELQKRGWIVAEP